ncbi:protein artichoke-like isoform X1 [Paramacrobiotus metropolitanus]|uniref:protein artichoke-like isoform X1 n=2 Tax=Paramacrobiotus metropolitanus TaxID=2943436 RepID=UPI002445DAA6|nr:protein artichoke-like isoform X1 [Paramacrobiotus metropolitanus]
MGWPLAEVLSSPELGMLSRMCFSEIPSLPRCPLDLDALKPCLCGTPIIRGLRIACPGVNLPQLAKRLQLLQGTRIAIFELRAGVIPVWDANLVGNITLLEVTLFNSQLRNVGTRILDASAAHLTRLALPGNLLEEVPPVVGTFPALRVLDLSYNRIASVPRDLLRGLVSLQELNLAGNLLRSVEAGAFAGLSALTQLNLGANLLQHMPALGFGYQHGLQVLNVSANNISTVSATDLQNLTNLYTLDLAFNRLDDVDGGAFRANLKIVYLFLDHNQLTGLPAGLFPMGMAVQNLTLSYNRLTAFPSDTLAGLFNLVGLFLSHNALTEVPSRLVTNSFHIATVDFSFNPALSVVRGQALDGLKNLSSISLAFCNLTSIEAGGLGDLQGVTALYLNNNNLSQMKAAALGFLPAVQQLQLSHNNISKLKLMEISGLLGVMTLNLSHNFIRTVSPGEMPRLPMLMTLDLSFNGLQEVMPGSFKDYLSLQRLYLHSNLLRAVDASTFGSMNSLLEADLSKNNISNFQRFAVSKLRSLRLIKVDDNFVTELFQAPGSLAIISARNNSISSIKGSSFPVGIPLTTLDLSFNNVSELELGAFAHLGIIETVKLRGNALRAVPKKELQNRVTLQHLDLGQNSIAGVDYDAFAGLKLRKLYLDTNQIVRFNETALNGLAELSELRLDGNRLPALDSQLLRGLQSLTSVDLSGNALTDVAGDVFNDLYSVRRVSLADNALGTLPRRLFDRNAFLESVDLSGNRLRVLPTYLEEAVNRLAVLNVSRNFLQEILGAPALPWLTALDLSRNALKQLSVHAFSKMPRLQRLLLDRNPLEILSDAGLNCDLKQLNLDYTLLHSVPFSLLLSLDQDNSSLSFRNVSIFCDCRAVGLQEHLRRRRDPVVVDAVCAGTATPIVDAALGADCEASRQAIDKLLDAKTVLDLRAVRAGRAVLLQWDTLVAGDIFSFGLNVEYANRSVHAPKTRLPYHTSQYAVPDLSFSTTYKACVQSFDSLGRAVGSPACKLVQLASLDTAAASGAAGVDAARLSAFSLMTLFTVAFFMRSVC